MDLDERFYPYRTTPARIALDAAEALASVEGIARVALLGAIAGGWQDGRALIDLLAAAADVRCALAGVAALHEALPLRYYHPSPDSPAPSGAYWLEGESPFHRVEIEFAPPALYDGAVRAAQVAALELRATGAEAGTPTKEVVGRAERQPPLIDGLPDVLASPSPPELALGDALLRSLDRMSEYLRGGLDIEPAREAMALLEEAYEATGRPKRTPAGQVGGLVVECRELWNTLHLAHLRAAGGIEVRDAEGLSG